MEERGEEEGVSESSLAADLETVFFSNMMLLGFDVERENKRHGVRITHDIFRRGNSKATEIVLHFLLSSLNPLKAKEVLQTLSLSLELSLSLSDLQRWITQLQQTRRPSSLCGPSMTSDKPQSFGVLPLISSRSSRRKGRCPQTSFESPRSRRRRARGKDSTAKKERSELTILSSLISDL